MDNVSLELQEFLKQLTTPKVTLDPKNNGLVISGTPLLNQEEKTKDALNRN